jgi:hypothetical protein
MLAETHMFTTKLKRNGLWGEGMGLWGEGMESIHTVSATL